MGMSLAWDESPTWYLEVSESLGWNSQIMVTFSGWPYSQTNPANLRWWKFPEALACISWILLKRVDLHLIFWCFSCRSGCRSGPRDAPRHSSGWRNGAWCLGWLSPTNSSPATKVCGSRWEDVKRSCENNSLNIRKTMWIYNDAMWVTQFHKPFPQFHQK